MAPHDMLEFHTLGSIELRRSDGRTVKTVLKQNKRLALLAYLAVSPGEYVRRDLLLPLFWPDLDETHARNALSQALYTLRRALGDEVIVNRGADEIGIPGDRLTCDVARFRAALDRSDHAGALELYRGDLLPGFHLSGAPEFERWLDETRRSLRTRATEAARILTAEQAAAGQIRTAADYARRAVELAPYDEAGLRAWIRLLHEAGDSTGALRAYEEFTERLADELDTTPSPETRELVKSIRQPPQRGGRGDASPDRANQVPEEMGRYGHNGRQRPGRGSWKLGSAAVTGLLAAAVGFLILRADATSPPGSPGSLSATRVAVLPFTYRGDATYRYLDEGIVDLLSTKLDGAGALTSVDPRAVIQAAAGRDALDPETGRRIARQLDAGLFVLGSIVEVGGRLEVTASLYSTPGDVETAAHAEAAREQEVFEAVDLLAAHLLARRSGRPHERLQRLAALTTESLPALKDYLHGERLFRTGLYLDALDAFERALDRDSSFALAAYRANVAVEYASGYGLDVSASQPVATDQRLPRRARLLLQARRASERGDAADAESVYREIVTAYPEDLDAWLGLAEVQFHYGPERGEPVGLAWPLFERVLELDPNNVAALIHLARIAAFEGRRSQLGTLTEQVLRLTPDNDRRLEVRALRAFGTADDSLERRVLAELERTDYGTIVTAAWRVAVYTHDLAAAARIAGLLTAGQRSREVRGLGHILEANLALAAGDGEGVWEALDRAANFVPTAALEFRAFFAALPLLPAPSDRLAGLRGSLRDLKPDTVAPTGLDEPFLSLHDDMHAELRAYLLGLLGARLDDTVSAARWTNELRTKAAEPGADASPSSPRARLAGRLARSLNAYRLWIADRPSDALAALQASPVGGPEHRVRREPLNFDGLNRYLQAMLLERARRDEQALRLYGSFEGGSIQDLVFAAPAHLRRAGILQRAGRQQEARAAYRDFLRKWAGEGRSRQLLTRAGDAKGAG